MLLALRANLFCTGFEPIKQHVFHNARLIGIRRCVNQPVYQGLLSESFPVISDQTQWWRRWKWPFQPFQVILNVVQLACLGHVFTTPSLCYFLYFSLQPSLCLSFPLSITRLHTETHTDIVFSCFSEEQTRQCSWCPTPVYAMHRRRAISKIQ